MSSPLASRKKKAIDNLLIRLHRKYSHHNRINILAHTVAKCIQDLKTETYDIKCLDVGCGDMQLSEEIRNLLPETKWNCIDIHPLPDELQNTARWEKYTQFNGENIPYDNDSYDVVLFCDVLHHVQTSSEILLKEACRVGKYIIVKDHYEYSLWSRINLWVLDFIGNWSYGVPLPNRYYTKESFNQLIKRTNLSIRDNLVGIELYSHLPVINNFLLDKWQFIATLEKKD